MTASALFDLYNRVHADFGLEGQPDYRYRNLRGLFKHFGSWCVERGIDPERWLRAKLEATGGRFRLRPSTLTNCSASFMEHFRDWGEGVQAEHQHQRRLQAEVVDDTPWGGGELIMLAESVKRALVDDRAACVTAPEAGGYHSLSPHCIDCAVRQRCWEFWRVRR